MGGEMAALIESIDFNTKKELLEKLRNMRKSALRLPPRDRLAVKQMIGIGIQQAYFTAEKELLRYKEYLETKKRKTILSGGKDDGGENSCLCQASV